jgi:hypothetical protein
MIHRARQRLDAVPFILLVAVAPVACRPNSGPGGERGGIASLPAVAASQPSFAQTFVVQSADQVAQVGGPLEKVVAYFTSTSVPSVIVGYQPSNSPGGLYLFTTASGDLSGPWQATTLVGAGDAYERAVAFQYPGDPYPGVIASIQPPGMPNHQIIWYENPANWGGDPLDPAQWQAQPINKEHGCHDLRLADMDGDGNIDVVCSASLVLGLDGEPSPSFIAFQNHFDDWTPVYEIAPLADGVDVVNIAGTPSLAGANTNDGNIYWYENPCARPSFVQPGVPCPESRSSGWPMHQINADNSGLARGNSFTSVTVGGEPGFITAANEEYSGVVYTPGVAWFHADTDPYAPWIMDSLDATYRDVHEISTGTWDNGVAYVIVAEQEQACPPAMPNGNPPDHSTPCRIGMFQYLDGAWQQTVLSESSTQNQSVIPYADGLLMAAANHGFYGADPTIYLWSIQPSDSPGQRTGGPGLAPGTYSIGSSGRLVDGGFGYYGDVPAVQFYEAVADNPMQEWAWNGSTLVNMGFSGRAMVDAGDGTVTEALAGDTWTVVQVGSGYTVRDDRTGNYLTNDNGTLSMAPASGDARQLWSFSSIAAG